MICHREQELKLHVHIHFSADVIEIFILACRLYKALVNCINMLFAVRLIILLLAMCFNCYFYLFKFFVDVSLSLHFYFTDDLTCFQIVFCLCCDTASSFNQSMLVHFYFVFFTKFIAAKNICGIQDYIAPACFYQFSFYPHVKHTAYQ